MNNYNIITFDTLPSTNLYLKQNYNALQENTVIITNNQTNGRGRGNRVWESNSDDLTFSILLKPNIDSNKIPLISLVVGASLCQTINKYITSYIKWPNDILVNDKKLAGILLEAVSSNKIEAIIVGIGININSIKFSDDLIIKATSLKKILNKDINKNEVLEYFLEIFNDLYTKFIKNNNEYLDICKKYNYLKNRQVYINNEQVKVLDINDQGNLIVIDNNQNIKQLYYGEVTLHHLYKK